MYIISHQVLKTSYEIVFTKNRQNYDHHTLQLSLQFPLQTKQAHSCFLTLLSFFDKGFFVFVRRTCNDMKFFPNSIRKIKKWTKFLQKKHCFTKTIFKFFWQIVFKEVMLKPLAYTIGKVFPYQYCVAVGEKGTVALSTYHFDRKTQNYLLTHTLPKF